VHRTARAGPSNVANSPSPVDRTYRPRERSIAARAPSSWAAAGGPRQVVFGVPGRERRQEETSIGKTPRLSSLRRYYRLNALGRAPRAELLHILTLPDFDRADRIGAYYGNPETRTFAELLIDGEEDPALRAVLVGMLRELQRG